jgi:hypothetical protein
LANNLTDIIKSLIGVLGIKITTNLYTILIIGLGLYYFGFKKETVKTDSNNVISYLDSISKQNKILFSKIDSLDLNKKEKLTVYHTTTLKYDTLKIIVDSMPPIDATLFLLSKSRHLTDKGIE